MTARIHFIKPPSKCDLCNHDIEDHFVDGATCLGPWACMCPECHEDHGLGLGIGRGQAYQRDPHDGKFYKVKV